MKTESTTSPDLVLNHPAKPAGFTRRTTDLPARFRREGKGHLLFLYHLIRLSDLGREGIERSASFRFADHIYRNVPSGQGWIGRWIDGILLSLPATRGMRGRFVRASQAIEDACDRCQGPVRVLAVPCGIPRDVSRLLQRRPELAERIEYTGMDIDPDVLEAARLHLSSSGLRETAFVEGDALRAEDFPDGRFDVIVSTGLGEFLNDRQLETFYGNAFRVLRAGGVFFTSASARDWASDYLLRAFELDTFYRNAGEWRKLLAVCPWSDVRLEPDITGLQTFCLAVR